MDEAERVLSFWFGELDGAGHADGAHAQRWWEVHEALDGQITSEFGALREGVVDGEHEDWLATPRGKLAYVIVLDQFSRNMFRGNAEAFAADDQALRAAVSGVELGEDRKLAFDERSFMYMPFMHCEDLAMQDRCIALFTAWRDEQHSDQDRERVAKTLAFAEKHRDIILRFTRFPHRNAVLARASTIDELKFLSEPGSSF